MRSSPHRPGRAWPPGDATSPLVYFVVGSADHGFFPTQIGASDRRDAEELRLMVTVALTQRGAPLTIVCCQDELEMAVWRGDLAGRENAEHLRDDRGRVASGRRAAVSPVEASGRVLAASAARSTGTPSFLGEHRPDQIIRPRQAAGVGGQKAVEPVSDQHLRQTRIAAVRTVELGN
jgi:hypothetical protein